MWFKVLHQTISYRKEGGGGTENEFEVNETGVSQILVI